LGSRALSKRICTQGLSGTLAASTQGEEAVMSVQIKPVVVKQEGVWLLRFQGPNGKVQEYRCNSEGQAKQLMQVLCPPTDQPS
jgi:hypothetical protein